MMKKKTRPPLPRTSDFNEERRHFSRRASDRDRTFRNLGDVVRRQADEIKIKNGQIRKGIKKQAKADEQIHIHTKAMESASDGIFIIDAQNSRFPVVYANPAFREMTGFAKKDILGRDYFSLCRVGADVRVIDEIRLKMRNGQSFNGEMLYSKKNDKKSWYSLRIAPVRDSGGVVTHHVGIQTDITSMREKELEIDEQRDELLHVTRVGKLAEFVSSLAHEISQPLTAILSCAQAAQRMFADREPKLQEILGYIISDNKRATAVIQRLRSLLKKNKSEMKPLDLNVLVNETVALIATDAAIRSTALKIEAANNLPLVCGDRVQLQQVLLNLVSNSFDALELDQEGREILIRTSRKDTDTVMIEVKDSGCGIPARDIPRLFSRFFTSKPDGLGMGLSISRSIVESHGGRINIKNNSGRGATFYFTLPVDKKAVL